MRRGLTRRMAVASVLLAVLIGAAFTALLLSVDNLRDSAALARETRDELTALDQLEKLVIDLETGVRGYVITDQERFLAPWNAARAAFPQTAAELQQLVAGDPDDAVQVRAIVRGMTSYIEEYATPLVEAARGGEASAHSVAATEQGKRRVDALRAQFERFRTIERARLTARQDDADAAARRASIGAVVGIAGSLALILLFAGYLTRVIVRPLRRAAGMADQLAAGDLHARLPEDDVGEIGALERSLNTMAGSLQSSEGSLRSLVDQQSALRRVATLVAQSVWPAEVFEAVTREVGLLSGADVARMERYEADATVTGVAAWSRGGGTLATGTRIPLEGVSIAARIAQSGGPERVESFAGGTGAIAEEARKHGIRSSVGCPIVVAGRLWGVIAASSMREAPFPADTESRIAEFTELVATAIANAESRAQLAASRARVVAAADETRRRIERDLHDGTQQRLVSLALELRLAESVVPESLPELRATIGRVADELNGAVEDLREISRGIHPAILSEGGLAPALRTLARRSAVPLELEVRVEARLAPETEVAAYYVVSESLTNAAKHASASRVSVVLSEHDGLLFISVRDDGVGGADSARGTGITGLRDRVEALGGSIDVESPAGKGTIVAVELPVKPDLGGRLGLQGERDSATSKSL